MKTIFGLLLMLLSIALGIYLGVWVMFIGGIAQFIRACQTTPIEAMQIACGLARFFFAGAVGWVSFGVLFAFGRAMLD